MDRLGKSDGYRARSAYKVSGCNANTAYMADLKRIPTQLLHLDEEYNLFEGVSLVADLCAAPGTAGKSFARMTIAHPQRIQEAGLRS
ncbi:tRNA (uridine-2'-O-)-methyltransferase trm7 [Cystobasidiomycetes sp. EMM_F5]